MSELTKISVAIIEDVAVIREDVVYHINSAQDMSICSDFDSIESFFKSREEESSSMPDVLLLDIELPGMSGLEALPIIKSKWPSIDVIMLTSFESQEVILKALCSGAIAYISKSVDLVEIEEAVRTVYQGGSYMSPQIAKEIVQHLVKGQVNTSPSILSERQQEILDGLVDGKSYAQIAEVLFVSIETVRTHIKKMYRTLQVNNKAEAIAMYLRGEIE